MLSFNTDDLRPQERFDYWCEVRARNLFGVTISLNPDERQNFRGRFSAVPAGGAILSTMQASPYWVSRTTADISRASSDSLCIYQQTGGASWFNSKGGGEFVVSANDIAISHTDLPYLTRPATAHGFDLRILKIPLTGREDIVRHARGLAPSLLRDNPRLKTVISASLAAVSADCAKNPESDLDLAVDHLAQLALLAQGRVRHGSPESRAALRFGFLHAARNILARNLHRPNLTPAAVAAELGISPRKLHLLFEPTGMSCARTLTAMRGEEALRLLRNAPTQPVAEIAQASGFDSSATFYR
ncbi:MAG: helix-turn-helix domain-containing protein, partial [Afipia sp.]